MTVLASFNGVPQDAKSSSQPHAFAADTGPCFNPQVQQALMCHKHNVVNSKKAFDDFETGCCLILPGLPLCHRARHLIQLFAVSGRAVRSRHREQTASLTDSERKTLDQSTRHNKTLISGFIRARTTSPSSARLNPSTITSKRLCHCESDSLVYQCFSTSSSIT